MGFFAAACVSGLTKTRGGLTDRADDLVRRFPGSPESTRGYYEELDG